MTLSGIRIPSHWSDSSLISILFYIFRMGRMNRYGLSNFSTSTQPVWGMLNFLQHWASFTTPNIPILNFYNLKHSSLIIYECVKTFLYKPELPTFQVFLGFCMEDSHFIQLYTCTKRNKLFHALGQFSYLVVFLKKYIYFFPIWKRFLCTQRFHKNQ